MPHGLEPGSAGVKGCSMGTAACSVKWKLAHRVSRLGTNGCSIGLHVCCKRLGWCSIWVDGCSAEVHGQLHGGVHGMDYSIGVCMGYSVYVCMACGLLHRGVHGLLHRGVHGMGCSTWVCMNYSIVVCMARVTPHGCARATPFMCA